MEPTFTFFWESDSPFSNWYQPSEFTIGEMTFNCSEQYMMYMKAMLFNDTEVADLIMEQYNPRKQKMLGREVRGFDQKVWMENCKGIMVPGLVAKFKQVPGLLNVILDTGTSILVEASPYDKVWGIGMTKDDPRAIHPEQWDGLNLLGDHLMEARDILSDEQRR